jgi:hypothetical protein
MKPPELVENQTKMPRTFFPLDQRLPGSSSHELLGCIVSEPLNPFHIYTPTHQSPSEILKDIEVDTTLETDIYTVVDNRYGSNLRLQLERLLNIHRESASATSRIIRADSVRTSRLRRHDAVFKGLAADPDVQAGLADVLKRGKGQAYLVVGVKTCYDGSFITAVEDKFSVTAEGTLPVREFAGALSTLGYVGKITDPKVTVAMWKQLHAASAAKGVGEQVFAVEYRLVRKRWLGSPGIGNMAVPQDGMFAGEDGGSKDAVVQVDGEEYELAENTLAGLPPQDTLLFDSDD